MILLLDDTYDEMITLMKIDRSRIDNLSDACEIVEKPTKRLFRNVLDSASQYKLICVHKSLKLFNSDGDLIDGQMVVDNFLTECKNREIPTLLFGRDISNNYERKTLSKFTLYTNLVSFITSYQKIHYPSFKILYYGPNFLAIERLGRLDKMIHTIFNNASPFQPENPHNFEEIKQIFPKADVRFICKKIETLEPRELVSYLNSIL